MVACREAAVERLIEVATGGRYEAGLIDTPFGISRTDAAAYIAGGVLNVLKGASGGWSIRALSGICNS